MNIHEYQAKELFEKFGVATPLGKVATTAEEAGKIADELGGAGLVVKAQVHAGGRGKGTFKNGFKGGVHVINTSAEAKEIASQMLGQTLVTHQTGPEGKLVSKVLVVKSVDIKKEFYFAILFDRVSSSHALIASTEGGMNIEEVAERPLKKSSRNSCTRPSGFRPIKHAKSQLHSDSKALWPIKRSSYSCLFGIYI